MILLVCKFSGITIWHYLKHAHGNYCSQTPETALAAHGTVLWLPLVKRMKMKSCVTSWKKRQPEMGSLHFPHSLFGPLTSVVMVTLPWVTEQPHQHGTFKMWSSLETVILQCYIWTQKPSRSFLGWNTTYFFLLLDFTGFHAHPILLLQHHRSLCHQRHSWFSKFSPFVLPLKCIIMFCGVTDFPVLIRLPIPWF